MVGALAFGSKALDRAAMDIRVGEDLQTSDGGELRDFGLSGHTQGAGSRVRASERRAAVPAGEPPVAACFII